MEDDLTLVRVNVGCGMSPTPGWINLDNSPSVRLAKYPRLTKALDGFRVLPARSKQYIDWCKEHDVAFGTALDLPFEANSVDAVYSSHMLEHLDQATGHRFLQEAKRVLKPGGVLRIAVPDLARYVTIYQEDGDADAFIGSLLMSQPLPSGWQDRVRLVGLGFRDHRWMYDKDSLVAAFKAAGFEDAQILPPGKSLMTDPGELDLHERAADSIYAEGIAPLAERIAG